MFIKIEPYHIHSADFIWFQNSCCKNIRKRIIKFHFRLVRMAQKYGLTLDELWSLYLHYWVPMGGSFWRYFHDHEEFRNGMIKQLKTGEYYDG